jgi:hypothetical protein
VKDTIFTAEVADVAEERGRCVDCFGMVVVPEITVYETFPVA